MNSIRVKKNGEIRLFRKNTTKGPATDENLSVQFDHLGSKALLRIDHDFWVLPPLLDQPIKNPQFLLNNEVLFIQFYHQSQASILNPENKIALLHIPKTAGSHLNKLLSTLFHESVVYTHVESASFVKNKSFEEVTDYQFISGHLSIQQFKEIAKRDFFFRTTMLRNPESQLISHIKWLLKIGQDTSSKMFISHPENIQKVALRLHEIDFTDVQSTKWWVNNLNPLEIALFDNCQTRYLIEKKNKASLNQRDFNVALKNLKWFHLVGLTEYLEDYLCALENALNISISKDGIQTKTNVNEMSFSIDQRTAAVNKILKPLIRWDIKLYKQIKLLKAKI